MTDAAKREFVASLYPGRSWKRTVSRMSNAQVFAIWKKEQLKLEQQVKQPPEKPDTDDIPF